MKQIPVDTDDDFWENHMKSFLLRFYHECMLPEILDSHYNRNMPIRNPEYISKAMTEVKLKKNVGETDKKRKAESDDCRQSQAPKRRVSRTIVEEESDECIIVSHEIRKGFTPEDAKLFRQALDNKTHCLSSIRDIVLPVGSRLNDESLDLRIVRQKYQFETQSVGYMYCHHTLVEPVRSKRSIQIIGGNATDHWRCVHFDGAKLRVYDSPPGDKYGNLVDEEKEYIRLQYPTIRENDITFEKVQQQPVGVSCGIYACAFATSVVMI